MKDYSEPQTYLIKTYGCQMNERDSETIAGIFSARGMEPVTTEAQADVVMVNTCTVRDKAEQKVFGLLGRLRKLKEERPHMILGICGCMPQQQKVAENIRSRFPFMDIIIGTHNLSQLESYLEETLMERRQVFAVWDERELDERDAPAMRSRKYKAFVNINWGCNNFCTYCIVPYVRGREKSRNQVDIVEEVRALVANGYLEVTLLGQNVNSFGKDLPGTPDFADLLTAINAVEGIRRIRFMTSHPRDMSSSLIDRLGSLDKVCRHVHLPLQAGSNSILKAMNRGYSREQYLKLVESLRDTVPDLTLTTDIIVGFPGESEQDFEQTLSALATIRFDSAFTFLYSPRKGTPAATMPNQVEDLVKKDRLQQLIELQNQISLEKNLSMIGQTNTVLFEDKAENRFKGRTEGNKLVFVQHEENLLGQIVPIELTEAKTWNLVGQVKENA